MKTQTYNLPINDCGITELKIVIPYELSIRDIVSGMKPEKLPDGCLEYYTNSLRRLGLFFYEKSRQLSLEEMKNLNVNFISKSVNDNLNI